MNAWLAGGFRHMWFSSTKNTNEQEVCWLNHQSFSEKNQGKPSLSSCSCSSIHNVRIIFPPFSHHFPTISHNFRIILPPFSHFPIKWFPSFSHHFPIIFPTIFWSFSHHFPYENWSNWVPGMTFKDLYSCTSQRQQDGMGCLCHMAIAVAHGRFSFGWCQRKGDGFYSHESIRIHKAHRVIFHGDVALLEFQVRWASKSRTEVG